MQRMFEYLCKINLFFSNCLVAFLKCSKLRSVLLKPIVMLHYKELGLVNSRELFKKAVKGGYAIPAFNFNNLEQLQAIIAACVETKSPVILQVSKGARKYANQTLLQYLAKGAVEYAKELGYAIPIVLHLDHGDSFETCKACIETGFSSVMIDGSHLPYDENIKVTKQVVEFARQYDVTVEGELGVLAGIEDEVSSDHSSYTRPEEVEDFVKRTGVDSLAISIGTSHGAYKFKVKPGEQPPPLRFDILEEVERRIPGFPIVLHGASSVPQDIVDEINRYGGKLENTAGVSEEQLRRAAGSAVCKINIDSDGRLAVTAAVRKVLFEKPGEFDPRNYLGPARDKLKELYKHKIIHVLGSADKA
jgi:fructose-bisphosphate aldolase class II